MTNILTANSFQLQRTRSHAQLQVSDLLWVLESITRERVCEHEKAHEVVFKALASSRVLLQKIPFITTSQDLLRFQQCLRYIQCSIKLVIRQVMVNMHDIVQKLNVTKCMIYLYKLTLLFTYLSSLLASLDQFCPPAFDLAYSFLRGFTYLLAELP